MNGRLRALLALPSCVVALLSLGSCTSEPSGGPCPSCPTVEAPAEVAEARFAGLSAEVEILRDSQGIPHIYGQTDEDVMYASGYMQARDRLFQMDLVRRQALGRRAEVYGEPYADDDALMRTLGLARWAREGAAQTRARDPQSYGLLVAWTAGVNAYIEEVLSGEAPLPYGFGPAELDYLPERWSNSDGFVVGKLILFGNSSLIEFEVLATAIRRFLPEVFASLPLFQPLLDAYILPEEERPVSPARGAGASMLSPPGVDPPRSALPPDAGARLRGFLGRIRQATGGVPGRGSNNWAVDGRFTENGRPLIAGDPHQGLNSPSLMWVQHINSADQGGALDVAGFAFTGTPGIQLGHNRHVVWTATTTYPDMMDLWEVRLSGDQVRLAGRELPIVHREEVIGVRGEAPRTIRVEEVPGYGVLLPASLFELPVVTPGNRVLLGWTGFRATSEGEGFLGFDRATSTAELEAAARAHMAIGTFNFVAADRDGITYLVAADVPDRGRFEEGEAQPWLILDGNDPATFWDGALLSSEQLPSSRAPARGWIATANNDPTGMMRDGSIVGDPFYYGVAADPGTRAARIEAELERLVARASEAGGAPITVADMQTLQSDTYLILADLFMPLLESALTNMESDPDLAEYRDRADLMALAEQFRAWDRRMERDSSAALAFHGFMHFVTEEAVGDDFGIVFEPILGASATYMIKFALFPLLGLAEGSEALLQQGRDRPVLEGLSRTAAWLTERYGGVGEGLYRWGDFHFTRFSCLIPGGGPLEIGEVSTDGGEGTVNVSDSSFFEGGVPRARVTSTGGSIYRLVASFDEDGRPRAEINFPPGNVADPGSPFFDNALESWAEDRYQPLAFSREEVEADVAERVVLQP